MKTKARLLCSSLLLSLIIMAQAGGRAESAMSMDEMSNKLFEQIQDIELMQRNIDECYQSEKRAPIVANWSGESWRDHVELDGALMHRVFSHLTGAPEYEKFIREYRTLVQRPDYKRLYTDELYAEYMSLLDSARIRFFTQLKERLESAGANSSDQAQEGSTPSDPLKTVMFEYVEGSRRTESGRAAPAVRSLVQMSLSDSSPSVVTGKSVSKIVVQGMDQFGFVRAGVPTIDLAELDGLVAQEGFAPLEKVSMGYDYGSVKGVRSGTPSSSQRHLRREYGHGIVRR